MLSRIAGHLRRCHIERTKGRERLGYTPSLLWPRTFMEKCIRRKLGLGPIDMWAALADKAEARAIAAERAGASILVPLHRVVDSADAITDLPTSCAVKATHGSGWNLFVRNGTPDAATVRQTAASWLGQHYGDRTGERWYRHIPPRLLIEHLLVDDTHGVPLDYKCFVFRGRVEYIQVDAGRFAQHTRTFYDREWRAQPWGLIYPLAPPVPRPSRLRELLELAETLAAGMDFVRVDLYLVNDTDLYFGEFTMAPEGGWGRFCPDRSVDRMLGRLW